MPVRSPEADLAMLMEEAERLERRRALFNARIDARLAENQKRVSAIRTFMELRSIYAPSADVAAQAQAPKLSPDSPFYGKPLAEAGALLLSLAGHSMNEQEIVAGLMSAGVPMASTNAVVNFRMAARRRPDLLFTRAGRWYLAESSAEEPAPVATGCVPNRSREDHIAKSLEGLALARARGVIGGRRSSIPEETRREAERLLAPVADGGEGLSANEVIKRLSMPRSTVYKIASSLKAAKKSPMPNGHNG